MRRRVRRIAADEPGLFEDVSDQQRKADGRCSVCQGELSKDAEDEEEGEEGEGEEAESQRRSASLGRCVKLSGCAVGHSFHLQCICSWVLIRGACPYCNTRL